MNVRGDTHAAKVVGRAPGGREWGEGPRGPLCRGLAVSGFMVMGLASGLSLANHSDSESFLVAHASLSQDGYQRGFWEVVALVGSPCDLSRLFWLVVAY